MASLPGPKERDTWDLQRAEAALKAKPDDPGVRVGRASVHLRFGENQKVIDDLDAVIKKFPQQITAYMYRAIAHARLGHKDQARADQEKFEIGNEGQSQKLYLAVIVATELDDGSDRAFDKLDTALKLTPDDSVLHYDAACACAQASQALAHTDEARSKSLSERALSLLRKAIENGYAGYMHMEEDADLDPIRNLPAFAEITKRSHPNRSCAAVWTNDVQFEAFPLLGLDLTAHLERCREMAAQGYRMVSLSVARTSVDEPPIAASVWHRPVITEENKDRLAERQARSAIALLRMGKAGEMLPLLRHSADPRLRSFIINWLSPLGAAAGTVAAELERLSASAQPAPVKGEQFMDTVLFHPETSQRRALILALGTYGTEGLSPGEQEPLTRKLLDLYRNDPDAGIHGAAEWTLRQWKQHEKLKELDAELTKLQDRSDRRWYLNSQGQTFALIERPVEFAMGSPPTEPYRNADEILHRVQIPRRFAIAATEVTVGQYREFQKECPGVQTALSINSNPDPNVPMTGVSWYAAAAYCDWLSRKESLPACYEPNEHGKYAEGMRIKIDALKLPGYRLPTEAEWEFACRSGAATGRNYGFSIGLLEQYAVCFKTYQSQILPCGSLLPDDLGLFDMLGNVWEWCQDRSMTYGTSENSHVDSDIIKSAFINNLSTRVLRGGAVNHPPMLVRSACRTASAPLMCQPNNGFRPARTYP